MLDVTIAREILTYKEGLVRDLQQPQSLGSRRKVSSWMWWCLSVIPALRRLRQENCEFEGSLGYITKLYLQKQKRRGRRKERKVGARGCSSVA
jgi:hypothetical protein